MIELLKLLVSLLPTLIEIVKAVDKAIPQGNGASEEKLAIAKGILESVYTKSNTFVMAFETVWPMISSVISVIVPAVRKTATKEDTQSAPSQPESPPIG